MNLDGQFGDIVKGLLSLEVNTIVRPGMLAIRMPAVPIAVHQIAVEYCTWLDDHGQAIAVPVRGAPPDAEGLAVDPADVQSLDAAAAAATTLIDSRTLTGNDLVLASRIVENVGALKRLIPALGKPRPDPDKVVQLRKIWEVGLESIALQTVIWLDGDVTQRIRADLCASEQPQIVMLHRAAVETSTRMWKEFASIITTIFETIWKKLG